MIMGIFLMLFCGAMFIECELKKEQRERMERIVNFYSNNNKTEDENYLEDKCS